tara:strand:- start:362 stop:574 length:213 start_codon:yes stop_codon:yes gene_type:complete
MAAGLRERQETRYNKHDTLYIDQGILHKTFRSQLSKRVSSPGDYNLDAKMIEKKVLRISIVNIISNFINS